MSVATPPFGYPFDLARRDLTRCSVISMLVIDNYFRRGESMRELTGELTERQRQIVDHAIEMISEGGISALTMRRLSERLGVTEPALYRHFENKTAILAAMLRVLEAETYERLPLDGAATPSALVAHFDRLFALLTERPALATVVFLDEFASTDPDLQGMVRRLLAKNRDRLAAVFTSIQASVPPGAPIDAESLATLLLGGVRLVVRDWRLDECRWDLADRGRRLVTTLAETLTGRTE
ncbi:MAG: TetR/AcrR family transcriptional regulator [Spirochaetaceae bacterium]|nr:MAG: TetR/AcrR family transcriptional regulator [Spirochaetaceae bacterium]